MKWRVIDYTENTASMNMAIDESVSESVAKGESSPTIRFYGWKPSAVSIGYFQSLEREVDLAKCSEFGVEFVRRRTGGGAVYHDNLGEITYSIIAKEELFPKDIIASYKIICGYICDSLGLLNIASEFKPINDIITNNKKISGNAQTRRNGVLLQHGTILYKVDVDKMFSLLKVPDEKIKDKMIATVKERVTSIEQQNSSITKDQLYRALVNGFTKDKEIVFDSLSQPEILRAEELTNTRYKTKEWNFMR
ncbi:lipoate--protein ligase family protein [Candidatus Micrarchaeota archaeon]|nr:lipoate--protein ligase family protein [Candidatus Micrarchaeota archaeon]